MLHVFIPLFMQLYISFHEKHKKNATQSLPASIDQRQGKRYDFFHKTGKLYTMESYEKVRRRYKPNQVKVLLIAESPPPESKVQSSRQFYYADRIRKDDRLFVNTIRALYPETIVVPEPQLEEHKEDWLRRFQQDGFYMIEALEDSQEHEVTKQQRQERIRESLPRLLERIKEIANENTKIILIKSNVFDVAAEPLRDAGYNVLNTELVDYPGRFNQRAYREKIATLLTR